jgi:hypothetical protein
MTVSTDPSPVLTAFTGMAPKDIGVMLGFSGKRAENRGSFVKLVADRICALSSSERWEVDDLKATQIEALDALIAHCPAVMSRIEHYLPKAATLKLLVEERLGGKITSGRLAEANEVWSALVSELVKPRLRRFLSQTLAFDKAGSTTISIEELIDVLTGDYADFVKRQAAGFISFVGGYNELLVWEALVQRGLQSSIVKTGKFGQGDIVVKSTAANATAPLNIEVKSYAARERLELALGKANPPKIGVGFFINASEFNPASTARLLNTQTLAIYMPEKTLKALHPTVLDQENSGRGLFYRPLSMLADDVAAFTKSGSLAFTTFKTR